MRSFGTDLARLAHAESLLKSIGVLGLGVLDGLVSNLARCRSVHTVSTVASLAKELVGKTLTIQLETVRITASARLV